MTIIDFLKKQLLGESAVMARLEAGDFRGKKNGTQWRITRAAIEACVRS
jgi:hypothetical protein